MSEPIERVQVGPVDEIGVYLDEDWMTLVYYDFQGLCRIEFPLEMAGPLGEALRRIAETHHHEFIPGGDDAQSGVTSDT